jgi:hypothetical protein
MSDRRRVLRGRSGASLLLLLKSKARGTPGWVMKSGGVAATMDLDFINDRAWIGGAVFDIVTVIPDARLEDEGVEVLAATPDDLIIDISDVVGFSSTSGTIITHARAAADAAANYALWGIDDGTGDNRLCQFRNTTPRITGFAAIGGSADLAMTDTKNITNGLIFKTAMAWEEDDGAIVVDGGTPATDASGGIPTGATRFVIGRDHNNAYWNRTIQRLTYFNVRLANAELQAKTAPFVPAAFAVGDWDIAAGDTEADVTINSLPYDNRSAITDVEYRIGSGSAVSSGGTSGFTIGSLTNGVAVNVQIRAVNAVGAGPWSDVKSVTPEAEVAPDYIPTYYYLGF